MGIQVDAAEVHDPSELRELGDDDLVRGAPRRERELHGLHPIGTLRGRALLEEELALDAVGRSA